MQIKYHYYCHTQKPLHSSRYDKQRHLSMIRVKVLLSVDATCWQGCRWFPFQGLPGKQTKGGLGSHYFENIVTNCIKANQRIVIELVFPGTALLALLH